MFGSKPNPHLAELTYLRTLVQDLMDRLERQEKLFAEERKSLIEQALKPFQPRPKPEAVAVPQRPHYPGYRPDLRPDIAKLQEMQNLVIAGKLNG